MTFSKGVEKEENWRYFHVLGLDDQVNSSQAMKISKLELPRNANSLTFYEINYCRVYENIHQLLETV